MNDPIAWIADGRDRLLTHVRRRIREPEQAEDVVQEAIMRVIEQERKQVIEQPLAYAFRVADSVLYNRGRRSGADHAPVDPDIASGSTASRPRCRACPHNAARSSSNAIWRASRASRSPKIWA